MSAATFQQSETHFYRQAVDEALAAFGTGARLGLSAGEARARLQRHAVLLSLLLQAAVIYIPFLQQAFSTLSLGAGDCLFCAAVASSVLWLRELSKVIARKRSRKVASASEASFRAGRSAAAKTEN